MDLGNFGGEPVQKESAQLHRPMVQLIDRGFAARLARGSNHPTSIHLPHSELHSNVHHQQNFVSKDGY